MPWNAKSQKMLKIVQFWGIFISNLTFSLIREYILLFEVSSDICSVVVEIWFEKFTNFVARVEFLITGNWQ